MMDRKLFEQEVSAWLKGKDTLKQIKWDIQDISSEVRPNTVVIRGILNIPIDGKEWEVPWKSETENREEPVRNAVLCINESLLQWLDKCVAAINELKQEIYRP